MIRALAYVGPTFYPSVWIEVPAGRVAIDNDTAYIEVTLDESAGLREQMHYAEAAAGLECEMPTCKSHQVAGGYCAEHGGLDCAEASR